MDTLNSFLMTLSPQTRNAIWYSFIVIFMFMFGFFIMYYSKKHGESIKKSCISVLLTLGTYLAVLVLAFAIDSWTNSLIFVSGNIYFLPGSIACAFVLSKYQNCRFYDALGQVTLSFLIARVVQVFGCGFVGCCQGFPVEWGIYSAISQDIVVPVNEIESVCLLIIWAALDRYNKHHDYKAGDRVSIYSFILVGAISYVADFFTASNTKLFFLTSMDGLVSFFTMCTGLILLYFIDNPIRKTPREEQSPNINSPML